MKYKSPLAMLYHWEKEAPGKVYLKQPIDSVWHTWTWEQTGQEVRLLAAAIRSMQLPANSHIALISKNCAHWIISDLAIMMAGHVSIPLYPNLQPATIQQILEHSEAKLLLAGKLDDWETVRTGIPKELKTISFPFCNLDGCEPWTAFTKGHQPVRENIDRSSNDTWTIVYTSGTTGMPKGVMYSFDGVSFVAQHGIDYIGFKNTDRFFSYLPLSHSAERMLVEVISIYAGAEVSFAESVQTFPKNLAEAKPTVFLGVHRIWSKFQQGILAKIPQKRMDLFLNIPFLSGSIKKKIKKSLGLSEASIILAGASPTPASLIKWFDNLGIRIQEAYAMTESCCYSHVTLPNNIKIGFVGQPLPHCEVRLGAENEILVRHKALMTGYYKEPAMTKDVFTEDGFLKTGDEGYIDEEGFLKITGRLKDLFKTSKGKYVAPSPIEMKFSVNNDLEQICVIGSGLPQPMALVTLSNKGKNEKKEIVSDGLKSTLLLINTALDPHEKVNKIVVLREECTIENNLLTPSLKIKRNELEKRYAAYYSEWYNSQHPVVWQ